MTAALYVTIWLSLVCLAAGEIGRRPLLEQKPVALWVRPVWTAGALLAAVHLALAFELHHDWSHTSAVEATARQTADVYGLDWGGGLFANYAIVTLWLAEAAWWRWRSASYARWMRVLRWPRRIVYFVIIVNAAVVFAAPSRRLAGAAICAALAWAWRPQRGAA